MKFSLKKYFYILNDITNMALNREKAKEDRRVKNLITAIIVVAVVLFVSLAFNVYFVKGF